MILFDLQKEVPVFDEDFKDCHEMAETLQGWIGPAVLKHSVKYPYGNAHSIGLSTHRSATPDKNKQNKEVKSLCHLHGLPRVTTMQR